MNRDKAAEPDDDQYGDDEHTEPADIQPADHEHDIAHRAAMHD